MVKKRGQNEGSITQLADGRWQARVTITDAGGVTRRKAYYGKTRQEAQKKMVAAKYDLQQGLPIPGERLTVAQFLERYMQDVTKHRVKASTFASYTSRMKIDILPALGRYPLSKLTAREIAQLYSRLMDQGHPPRRVRYDHAVLKKALDQAVRWNLIPRNPADGVDLPRSRTPEYQALTPEQVKRFLAAAQHDRYSALYVLALATGMRAGELLGLRWSDVNWDTGAVHVRQQVGRTKAHGLAFSEPKTAKGRRTIPLPSQAIAALKRHHTAQRMEQLAAVEWHDLDLVFANGKGKPTEIHNLTRRSFQRILERAGLPRIRFHDLRHTAATLLLSQGVHPKVVQERLGHATIAVTMDVYSHVLPSMQQDAAEKLERLLEEAV